MSPVFVADSYRPRRAWFQELVEVGAASIKLNAICGMDRHIEADVFDTARARLVTARSEIERTPQLGAGFAILHEGDEGRWLLLHWWVAGGIATRKLWRADLVPHSEFIDADPLLMACVWELGIIDFERRAWMRTAMSGKPVSDYIADRFSGEYV